MNKYFQNKYAIIYVPLESNEMIIDGKFYDMDKEQFLKSGLLEQYVLGLTSSEEEEVVDHYLDRFPELKAEVNNLHHALLTYAAHQDIPPPKRDNTPFVSKRQNKTLRSTLVLAPVLLLAGLLLWAYQHDQHHQMKVLQLEAEYAALKTYNEQTQEKQNLKQVIIAGSEAILLKPLQAEKDYFAIAYWNPEHRSCWFDPIQLPLLEKGFQYQVWADVHGEMISIGLIPSESRELIKLDFLVEAESINVTVEQAGGADRPNISMLSVYGLL